MDVHQKQRCVTEFLQAEEIKPLDIHRRFVNVYGTEADDWRHSTGRKRKFGDPGTATGPRTPACLTASRWSLGSCMTIRGALLGHSFLHPSNDNILPSAPTPTHAQRCTHFIHRYPPMSWLGRASFSGVVAVYGRPELDLSLASLSPLRSRRTITVSCP